MKNNKLSKNLKGVKMETNNFSFSNFSLSVSDVYESQGKKYKNYDFRSEDENRFAFFSVYVGDDEVENTYIPDCYDFSDYETKEAFEELFETKTNDEIKDFFFQIYLARN